MPSLSLEIRQRLNALANPRLENALRPLLEAIDTQLQSGGGGGAGLATAGPVQSLTVSSAPGSGGNFTPAISLTANNDYKIPVAIAESNWVGRVTVQVRPAAGSWRDHAHYLPGDAADGFVLLPTADYEVRIGVQEGDYTSGSVDLSIGG